MGIGPFHIRTEAAWTTNGLTRPAGGAWSVVPNKIRNLKIKRGTQVRSSTLEPGSATCELDNHDRSLDPTNTAGPHWPNVRPLVRMRFIAVFADLTEVVLFTGFVERWPMNWGRSTGWVSLRLTDLFGMIAGDNLPPSVLDVVTRQLGATHCWPGNDQIDNGTIDDTIGTVDGVFLGGPTAGPAVVPFDSRPVPKFTRPQVAGTGSHATAVHALSSPDKFTISFWWQWDVTEYIITGIVLSAFLKDTDSQAGPSTGGTPIGLQMMLFQAASFLPGERHVPKFRIKDGTNACYGSTFTDYVMLDGKPKNIVWAVDGSAKSVQIWINGIGGTVLDTSGSEDPSADPWSAINFSSVIASVNTLLHGTGIDWGTSYGVPTSASNIGEVAFFGKVLTDPEVNALYDAGIDAWNGDLTGTRAGAVLDLIGVDAGDRTISAGTQICGPTLLGSQNGMGYLRKLVVTEQNVCYVSGDGKIIFPNRVPASPAIVQIFSDKPSVDGGVPYSPVTTDFSWDRIINRIIVGRENGADQLLENLTSSGKYGKRSGAIQGGRLDTLHQQAVDARATGQFIVDRYGNPRTFIEKVSIDATGGDVTRASILREIGDACRLFARPAGGGSAINATALIEHLEHDIPGDNRWTTTYSLVEYVP